MGIPIGTPLHETRVLDDLDRSPLHLLNRDFDRLMILAIREP